VSTRLVLVRHGETVNHSDNRYTGLSDVELTDRGRRQAEALAVWAEAAGLTAIRSSPLTRARGTAEPSAERAGLPLLTDHRLVELDFGVLDGLTADEARTIYPEHAEAFFEDPTRVFPGGEPVAAAAERAVTALTELAGEFPGGRVLVVAHSTILRLALCALIGIPLGVYRSVFPVVGNCRLTEIRLSARGASLLTFNAPAVVPPPGVGESC
jgi:broad specificity phosphatase PhoE